MEGKFLKFVFFSPFHTMTCTTHRPCHFLVCTLFHSSLAHSFAPSSSSCASSSLLSHSPPITSLSSLLPSLSFLFTFIQMEKKKHTPLPFSPSYPVILSSLSVLFLILPPHPPHLPSCLDSLFILTFFVGLSPSPLAPPLPPPALREGLLSSRLLKHSRLSGQGSTTAHFTHGRVCCMPVMYVCCWRWRHYSWLASETQ